jgi:hypothetical protein
MHGVGNLVAAYLLAEGEHRGGDGGECRGG